LKEKKEKKNESLIKLRAKENQLLEQINKISSEQKSLQNKSVKLRKALQELKNK
jgi:hypothetical protein